MGEDNEVHKELTVEIKRCRDKPDFDNFLTEYRSELINKSFAQSDTKLQGLRGRGLFTSQKSKIVYEKEVADHIEDYRQYLEKIFAAQIADSVAAWIQPVIANNGRGPAEKTAFSIALPLTYQYPNENVYLIAEMIHDNEIESLEFELTPPKVPTLYSNPMELDIPLSALQSQGWSNFIEQASNTVGPKYSRDSDGSCLIEYEVKELIQYKPEKNLEPFLIWLEGIQQSTTWQIPVKIVSASLQKPLIDNLVIHINVLDEQESG